MAQTLRRLDYRPYPFIVKHAHLTFRLDPARTIVNSLLKIQRKSDTPKETPLVLNLGKHAKLIDISINHTVISPEKYVREDETVTFMNIPDEFDLAATVEIAPEKNESGEGLYMTDGVFCTQCEADGFREITLYPDRPDVLAPITTTIIADKKKYPVLLSNGNPIEKLDLEDGAHRVTWQDPTPKPCYIFALVAGNLAVMEDEFVAADGRKIALRLYSDNERTLATCRFALDSLKKAMKWDEEEYGRIYELDCYMIVAVSKFNSGAMENKGLNIFNLKYVSGNRYTVTDYQLALIEGVIGHEYFHNWRGNRVTCRDWFQLSLKEGLTVMTDSEFSRHFWGLAKLIDDAQFLREKQFAEDAGPLAHPVRLDEAEEIRNFYTLTVYEKGAEVVRMQKVILGRALFRKGMDLYFSRHDGQAATCDDFVRAMEDVSGIDLTQFRRWYSQAGTPTVHIRSAYDAKNQTLALHVRQTCPPTPGQPTKEPFHIPLALGMLDSKGNDMDISLVSEGMFDSTTGVLHVKEAEQTFVFGGVTERPVLSLNRSFSAPIKVDYLYTTDELCFLARHDTDKFNRWDALQEAIQRVFLSVINDGGGLLRKYKYTIQAILNVFCQLIDDYTHGRIDSDLLAAMLVLPTEQTIANECATIDPDRIHEVRESLKELIAVTYREKFEALYKTHSEPYVFDPKHVARRAIKNICLDYLSYAYRSPDGEARHAKAQFDQADNMTDELAALRVLVNAPTRRNSPAAEKIAAEALRAFFEKHKDDRNAIDTWFGVHATSPMTSVAGITALMGHPEFSLKVPNRVYALIKNFCEANPTQFHKKSGLGYQLLSAAVIELDAFNAQVASRIVEPLTNWKRYDATRQTLMKHELERIRSVRGANLSKGVKEKIEKSLA